MEQDVGDTGGEETDTVGGPVSDLVTDEIQINRRSFLKTATLLAGGGVSSALGVSVFGQPVVAQTEGGSETADTDEVTNIPGGAVDDVTLNGQTEFTIQWEDLIRGDIIQLDLRCTPTHLSTPESDDGSARDGVESMLGSTETIGRMGYQVPKGSGKATITGHQFFEDRTAVSITDHSDVSLDFVNVDLSYDVGITDDNPHVNTIRSLPEWSTLQTEHGGELITASNDDYVRVTVFNIELMATMPGSRTTSQRIGQWDLLVVINALAGWGMTFGESFGFDSTPI
jgi:hypothetical protein